MANDLLGTNGVARVSWCSKKGNSRWPGKEYSYDVQEKAFCNLELYGTNLLLFPKSCRDSILRVTENSDQQQEQQRIPRLGSEVRFADGLTAGRIRALNVDSLSSFGERRE